MHNSDISDYDKKEIFALSENEHTIERFRNQLENYLKPFDEDIIISWERKLTLKNNEKNIHQILD